MKGHEIVGIARFKAHLSRYLRWVRGGRPLTLVDRDTPVARVVPIGATSGRLGVLRPVQRLHDVRLPAGRATQGLDSLALLLAERGRR